MNKYEAKKLLNKAGYDADFYGKPQYILVVNPWTLQTVDRIMTHGHYVERERVEFLLANKPERSPWK